MVIATGCRQRTNPGSLKKCVQPGGLHASWRISSSLVCEACAADSCTCERVLWHKNGHSAGFLLSPLTHRIIDRIHSTTTFRNAKIRFLLNFEKTTGLAGLKNNDREFCISFYSKEQEILVEILIET